MKDRITLVVDGHAFVFQKDDLVDFGCKQSIDDFDTKMGNGLYNEDLSEDIQNGKI